LGNSIISKRRGTRERKREVKIKIKGRERKIKKR
jgi:hypothetical protein